jgi:hypothetical protein
MGTWTTKFRKPALLAGVLAINLAVSPAFATQPAGTQPRASGSKRGGVGFTGGAIVGAAAGGPIGMVVERRSVESWVSAVTEVRRWPRKAEEGCVRREVVR